MNKTIRPEWCTTVGPEEYDIDRQLETWLKYANEDKAQFYSIDVGKLWGLYLAWKELRESIEEIAQLATGEDATLEQVVKDLRALLE